jgi:uncharacterized protein (TIGR01777 family)
VNGEPTPCLDRERSLTIVIGGASGLIGAALGAALGAAGHTVLRLVRRAPRRDDEITWDPAVGHIDGAALEGVAAVVNLSGESVASGRWTASRRRRIVASRVETTALLARTLATRLDPPEVLVSASGVNYYGDTGDRLADEQAPAGEGFLADLCKRWEAAAEPARKAGIRVVHPRFGPVLTARGGMLAKLLPLFKAGLGGSLGDGRQWMSWIALPDAVAALTHLIERGDLRGPFNVVSPAPVTNADFTRILGGVLGRPTLLRAPGAALRVAFGHMARETLLISCRAVPRRLLSDNFSFSAPTLEAALRSELE